MYTLEEEENGETRKKAHSAFLFKVPPTLELDNTVTGTKERRQEHKDKKKNQQKHPSLKTPDQTKPNQTRSTKQKTSQRT